MANSDGEGKDAWDTESEIVSDDGSEMAIENRNISVEEAKKKRGRPLGSKNRTRTRLDLEQRRKMEAFVFAKGGCVRRSPGRGRAKNNMPVTENSDLASAAVGENTEEKILQEESSRLVVGETLSEKDRGREWDYKFEAMNESMAQMIGGLEKRLMGGVDGVTQEIKKIKKECQSVKLLFYEEIEIMKKEMARKETEWATEKQLFKTRIERLEEKAREGRGPQEESVKLWIEEEVEKRIAARNMTVPEVQQQERWLKNIKAEVERIATEKSQEGTDRALASMESKFERTERQTRRSNIIIRGGNFKGPNLKVDVEEFFERKMQSNVQVKKVATLGRNESDNGLAVLVHLGSLEEKQEIMRNRVNLKGTKIYVDDDLTRREREIHKKIWQRAKEEEAKGSRVKRGYMKLIVDGKCWKWNERLDRLVIPNFRN